MLSGFDAEAHRVSLCSIESRLPVSTTSVAEGSSVVLAMAPSLSAFLSN
jgi:hypothetical protein